MCIRDRFHLISAVIGVPAIVYSGRVFFASAWGALKHGRTNMDVPISIGITLATGLSIYESLTHGEEAWFDGTLMLIPVSYTHLDVYKRQTRRFTTPFVISPTAMVWRRWW